MSVKYRAVRNEPRVGIGNFTMDFYRDQMYEEGDERGQVPDYICDYLVSHGLLVDSRITLEPAGSPVPPTSPLPPSVVTPLSEDDE
jgi:hypothetical protein